MTKLSYPEIEKALFRALHDGDGRRRTGNPKLLVSFDGVVEPLLNLPLVEDAMVNRDLLARRCGYDKVGISISSMFPNDGLRDLWRMVAEHSISACQA